MVLEKLQNLERMIKVTLEEILEETESANESGNSEEALKLIARIAKDFLTTMDSPDAFSVEDKTSDEESLTHSYPEIDFPTEETTSGDYSRFKFATGSTVIVTDKDEIFKPTDFISESFGFKGGLKLCFNDKEKLYNGVPATIMAQINTPEAKSTTVYVIKSCGKLFFIHENGLREFNPATPPTDFEYEFEFRETVKVVGLVFYPDDELFEHFNITDATLFPEEAKLDDEVGIVVGRTQNPYFATESCYVIEVDKKRYFVPGISLETNEKKKKTR